MVDFESLGEFNYTDLMVTQVTPKFLAIDSTDLVASQRNELELLSPEERIVLYLLASSSAQFTFQGIKRRAGLHQQKISRALSRLDQKGLVQTKPDGSHKITQLGFNLAKPLFIGNKRVNDYSKIGLLEHRQTLAYSHLTFPFLCSALAGKWFDQYRFVSQSTTSLEFISDDRTVHLALKIDYQSNCLIVISYAPSYQMAEEAVSRLTSKIKLLITKEGKKATFKIDSEAIAA
ncbi:MAG: MarR family transcriptional regulator [Candidatus Heimdallarchaeota archaeon]|nr:MarR family transcriptional regulator [Candidatus Heimdallarchaeota archaeon]MCK5047832.1 MarR family transcriptional regulator [Candidatus Heimdallarchaeota archaeon]